VFCSYIFSLISFDPIPVDDIYDLIFKFENTPLTDHFEEMGY